MQNIKKNLSQFLKKILRSIWFSRSKFLNIPLPCFLPLKKLFLAYGDEIGASIFLKKYENEWKIMPKILKEGMVFFDIGANQGFYSLLASSCVGKQGKVFAFEPVPNEFKKLKRNIILNRLKNVQPEQIAIGAENGLTNLFICLNGKEAYSSLKEPNIKVAKKKISVLISTLDDYLQKNDLDRLDFIKIDVEGGELNVLKGAINVLKNLRPLIMCELSDARTKPWGYEAFSIYKFLLTQDYCLFRHTSENLLEPAPIKEKYDPEWENLIALPKEKINQTMKLLNKN